jgi:uncharacterized protein YcbX
VTVWEDSIQAYEVDSVVSDWFSRLLISARLVYMPEESHRKVEAKYAITEADINFFHISFLLIGQSSLDDLNLRLKEAQR